MKKMTKAERIYEATRRECKDIITGTHGYSEGQRLSGLATEEVVCMRTINAIMKLVDKEEHRIRLDEKLGVLSGEKLQLYINVNNMVRSTVENVKKSLKKFLDDLKPNSEYSKWLDERVEAMEAQEKAEETVEQEVETTETVEQTTEAETETEETVETTAEQETVEGISKMETTPLIIHDGTTSVRYTAFKGRTGLTSVVIPDSVTSIGYSAFEGCTGLTSMVIPDSVTSIGSYAFFGCTGLTSMVIPDSVTSIGNSAFANCTGLTSMVIPDSVISIGYSAFEGCTGLTSIVIPDSVTEIGDWAFYDCTGLTIYGVKGSHAETYAKENNIPFCEA